MTFWEWFWVQPFYIRWPIMAGLIILSLASQAVAWIVNLYRSWKGLPPIDKLSFPKKGN